MQYAFILGRVYTLSLAELIKVLRRNGIDFTILVASIEVAIIETSTQLDFEKLQKELGGVIKIVKIIDFIKKREKDSINFALQNYFKPSRLKKDYFKDYSGKKQFGISIYLLDPNIKAFGEPKRIGMFIKKGLQSGNVSLRAVLPDFNSLALPSVNVTKNQVLEKGAEICVIAGIDRVYVGKTLVVQDFEDYGRRDYQRPARDEKQGMIPPKVAQIMINFAGAPKGKIILDPFCGVGTILQEGMLLGYKMYGSDISQGAIRNSEKNLEWFRNRYRIPMGRYRLEQIDVTNIAEVFKDSDIATIVSEGSLGPMYTELPKQAEIEKNFKEIKGIWTKAFEQFSKVLKKDSRAVICLPAYKNQVQRSYVNIDNIDFITSLGYTVENHFPEAVRKIAPFLKVTDRNSIIYDRKEQIVAREIITFIKK